MSGNQLASRAIPLAAHDALWLYITLGEECVRGFVVFICDDADRRYLGTELCRTLACLA